jgi:hypothetical protein
MLGVGSRTNVCVSDDDDCGDERWLAEYSELRALVTGGAGAVAVLRLLAGRTNNEALREHFELCIDFVNSVAVEEPDLSESYKRFVYDTFSRILQNVILLLLVKHVHMYHTFLFFKMCTLVLPELTYRVFARLRERGVTDVIEETLERRLVDLKDLRHALINCRHVKFVNKVCLETGLSARIAALFSSNDFVSNITIGSPLFDAGARMINFVVKHVATKLADSNNLGHFFDYATNVFDACNGDTGLFQDCMRHVERVCPLRLPKNSGVDDPFLFHVSSVTDDGTPVWFSLRFVDTLAANQPVRTSCKI